MYQILERQQRNKNIPSIKSCTRSCDVFEIKGKQIFKAPLQTGCVTVCIKFIGLLDHLFACI